MSNEPSPWLVRELSNLLNQAIYGTQQKQEENE
jgi:hypothetical protein